jgi:hypothetical protein
MDMTWDTDHTNLATKIAIERFAMNSVAGHFAPPTTIDKMSTTVPANRFDFGNQIVVDNETLNLFEPFARCNFTLAQVNEFASLKGDAAMQSRVVTAITRAASALARWHDVLFFSGLEFDTSHAPKQLPPGVEPGSLPSAGVPQGLRQAAIDAEKALNKGDENPVIVGGGGAQLNEDLVAAVYKAVLLLETLGYFTTYHLILGERLWEELYRPTAGSLVLPRDRIEPTLLGGHIHRTTTLPSNEALIASLDGPTFDCVIAADSLDQHPSFELLPTVVTNQTVYQARVVERFAPRVRENRAVVRLQIAASK